MPPRRSNRVTKASLPEPAVLAPPVAKRKKSSQKAPPKRRKSNQPDDQHGVPNQQAASSTAPILSPDQFDILVSRVSLEVKKVIVTQPSSSETRATPTVVSEPPSQPLPVATSGEQLDESVIEEPIVPSTGDTSARQLVDTAIGALHSSMQGEHRKPSQMFHSVGLSLDASIPEKVKTKIFNNEYIDFGVLISNHLAGEDKYQISIVNGRSGQPSLFFEPSNKPKRIVNIEGWMSAFRIFVTVYTRKYPADAPAPMKYGDVIQDLASRSHNWKFYDENFRFMRQSQPEAYPWGTVQWELWLRSQVTPQSSQSTPATGFKGTQV